MEKTQEQLRAESEARVQKVHDHVMQVVNAVIPEDAPADFVLTDEVKESNNGLPWWWGPEVNDADVKLTLGEDGEVEQR